MRKILSLILTVCMLVAMASAALVTTTFTDSEAINFSEAVDVLSAISVINGYTDGTFKPKGEVTRAEMAKMISVLLNKGEDVGPLYQGACTFADSVNHWAAGYIAYCAQEHIINGRNAATFDPNANVTGTEAAKMLLCALGYNPNVENLVGANWAANTLSLAKKLELKARNAGGSVNEDQNFNLLTDLDSLPMSTPLTREAAAKLILNAMLCTKVDYDGNAQTITIGNTSFTTGATLLSLRTSIYDTYHTLAGTKRLTKGMTTGDDFGRPATTWTLGGETIGSYSTSPVARYVNAVTGGHIYTDLGKPTFGVRDTDYSLTVYIDGVNVGDSVKTKIVSGNTEDVTPMGSTTEVYVDDDAMIITMVIMRNYIAQIMGVYEARTDYNGDITQEAYITLKSVEGGGAIPSAEVELKNGTKIGNAFITNDFTTADRNVTYVVYTKAGQPAKIQSVTRAIVKTGIAGSIVRGVINTKATAIILDGVTYNIAESGIDFRADYGSNATLYLDSNGTVLYGEATASNTIAFVLQAGQESDMYQSKTTGANLLFTDGRTQKVNVYNENGYKYTDSQAQELKNKIVSYTINASGEYVLTVLDNATTYNYGYKDNIISVQSNNPNLLNSNMFANDSTTFIIESKSTDATGATTYSYSTYVGLKNVPTVEEAEFGETLRITAVNSRVNPSVASYVFVVGGKVKDASRASVAVFKKNPITDFIYTDANNNEYYVTKAVIDGQIVSVKMSKDAYNNGYIFKEPGLNAFTNISTDINGYITGLAQATDMPKYVKDYSDFNGIDGLYHSGTISLINGTDITALSVTANTPVYVYDEAANTITTISIDMFNTNLTVKQIKVVFDSTNKLLNNIEIVTAIYVVVG